MRGITTDDKHRLALIDALRCFAAFWVVLFHLSEGNHIPTLLAAIPGWVRAAVFNAGHLGVPIFFVLSGIVMTTTTARVPMDSINATSFVARRLVRLVPPYYAAVALGLLVIATKYMTVQSGVNIPSTTDILAHLAFLQGVLGIDNIITVFWTLCIEMQFYITFAMLMWLADRFSGDDAFKGRNIPVWICATLALLWPSGLVQAIGWQGGFIGFWFSFMTGVLCAQALSGTRQSRYIAIGYSALVLLIGIASDNSFTIAAGLTGVGFCFLVPRFASLGFLSSDLVQKVGLISYSLYLFHSPVTGTFMWVLRRFIPTGIGSDVLAVALIIVVCIAFAAIAYVLFERPAIAWSRRIKFKRPDAATLERT
ncbi:acyltransferase family protein [Pseudomonas xanthosomatis]|uniref:acyltransferase family protein n=1 Tax=Pseudomonas xanthosomatis TaxID=2842356 RepID=UPI00351649F7